MLEQLVLCLVLNARDSMPTGGRLLIRTSSLDFSEEESRRLLGSRPGSCVCLTVTDTGLGLSPDQISRVFEPFLTAKDVGRRSGLCLAMVYGIVKQHNGWVQVSSQPGQGSSFKVYLPSAEGS